MGNYSPEKPPLRVFDGYALDFIKFAAALFMVNDHINAIWLHHSHMVMLLLGRTTFPLFCYAVAVAVWKIDKAAPTPEARAAKVKRYFSRMMVLALLTQLVYPFSIGDYETVNVIFTLALGALFAEQALRLRPAVMYALFLASVIAMLWVQPLEFGLAGVMAPAAMLMAMRGDKKALCFTILLLLFVNAGGILEGFTRQIPAAAWAVYALTGVFSVVMPWFVLEMAAQLRGEGRFLPKYALHVFYPGHMLALRLLGMAFL